MPPLESLRYPNSSPFRHGANVSIVWSDGLKPAFEIDNGIHLIPGRSPSWSICGRSSLLQPCFSSEMFRHQKFSVIAFWAAALLETVLNSWRNQFLLISTKTDSSSCCPKFQTYVVTQLGGSSFSLREVLPTLTQNVWGPPLNRWVKPIFLSRNLQVKLRSRSQALELLVARENLNTVILNLYPGNKGYSLAFRQETATGKSFEQHGDNSHGLGTSRNVSWHQKTFSDGRFVIFCFFVWRCCRQQNRSLALLMIALKICWKQFDGRTKWKVSWSV